MEKAYAVVWPRSSERIEAKPLAARLDTLEGKRIAFLWDYLFRGDEVWPILKEALSARFPNMRFVDYDVFGSTHGEDEHRVLAELPGKLQQLGVGAVISGMGC